MKKLTILTSVVLACNSFASDRGLKTYFYQSPQGKEESCVIPKHIEGVTYDKDDEEVESRLCSYDIYGLSGANDLGPVRVSIEPKLNSTNPGTLFKLKKPNGKISTVAKFKQTISCSNTSAPLSYYHLSRYLGDIVNVKPAVIRTMDKEEHLKITNAALKLVNPKELIGKTWAMFSRAHENPASKPELFVDGNVYGALIDDRGDKGYYKEANGPINSYETRYSDFQTGSGFKKAASTSTIADLVSGLNLQGQLQTYQLMKDVSEVVLMDSLLNQQDRVGNIHYYYYWFKVENGILKKKKAKVRDVTTVEVKKDKSLKKQIIVDHNDPESVQMKNSGAVLVKVLTLRDNDCGVSKGNEMRRAGILEKIRHMSPKTYSLALKLASEIRSPQMKNFLTQETLMTEKDYNSVVSNAEYVAKVLRSNCLAGLLKLDVTKENAMNGTAHSASCE